MFMCEFLLRFPFHSGGWGFPVFIFLVIVALLVFIGARLSQSEPEEKKSSEPVPKAPNQPVDPDELPGTEGGPYARHPKYPPGGQE